MKKDFFISRTGTDKGWAEWVAWQLEETGHSVIVQDWDFRPGHNFPLEMHQAIQTTERTIAILSPDYLVADYAAPEWAAVFAQDPKGEEGHLITVCVRECEPDGLLKAVIYIDLVALSEEDAKEHLLDGVKVGRAKPPTPPLFPGSPGKRCHTLPKKPRFPGALPPIWNVPHLRNRNFTGREALLTELRATLASGQHAALTQAITGLGGVGKTQLTMEYAYRHMGEYDLVWWMRAEEPATLATDYAQLATELTLPAKDLPSQPEGIATVHRWLEENSSWLLVFDNAGSPEEIRPYLPQSTTGHVLITSRNPNWMATAFTLPVSAWEREEAVEFLCRRTKQMDKAMADELAKELGDLPLALEQAAAYVEATGGTLAEYLDLFRRHHLELMKRDRPPTDYKNTITTTWKLAFERVQASSPAGADLLRLCAFLAPDDIPKEVFTDGRKLLPEPLTLAAANPLEFNQAVADLRRYSLVNVGRGAISVHRLVQAVQRDQMTEIERQYWSGTALHFFNQVFHIYRDPLDNLQYYSRLLPHAVTITTHSEKYFPPEHPIVLASLSNLASLYFRLGTYDQAEPLFQQVLDIKEKTLGPEHPDLATWLNNLAGLYQSQGKYEAAEPLYIRALAIQERTLSPDHPGLATTLNNLGLLYDSQGKYEAAEPLYVRALAIREKVLGPDHPDLATTVNNLALLYGSQGKYESAEPLYVRALAIIERVLGPDHPNLARGLNNLAALYHSQGKYQAAEPLAKRALAIKEKVLGPNHPDVAVALNSLAILYAHQGKYEVAEPLYIRTLDITEKALGSDHPNLASALNNLAAFHLNQSKYDAAEPLIKRALTINEKTLGPNHPHVATTLNNLARLYYYQSKYEDAEPVCERSLAIGEHFLGPDHPDLTGALNNLAILYHNQGKHEKAEPLYQRALAIQEKALGPNHPEVATVLNNLAGLYKNQGKYEVAEPLYQRALAIREKAFGPDHPNVATALYNLAALYEGQGKYTEAEPFYQRELAIQEKTLDPDNPGIANTLNSLATLHKSQKKYEDAEVLFRRVLHIRENAMHPDNHDLAIILNNLAALYHEQGKFEDAEPLLKRTLTIVEKAMRPDHPSVAAALHNLAALLESQSKYEAAEALYKRALAILLENFQPNHPDIKTIQKNYDRCLTNWEKTPGHRN